MPRRSIAASPAELPTHPNGETEEPMALEVLEGLAHGRFGAIPPGLVARQVLAVTAGADWPVQRAALEALIRRWGFARRDELRVAARPRGRVLGLYATSGARGAARPYRTLLASLDPPRGSCDCPDFLRSSLGLCKHLLVALNGIFSSPQRVRRAELEQAREAGAPPRLSWDPIRPLAGEGDWLERVTLSTGPARAGRPPRVRERFGEGSPARLLELHRDAPRDRLALVKELERAQALGERSASGETRWPPDPALDPLLRAERARLERQLDGEELIAGLPASLRTLRRRLYPYQVEGVRAFLASGSLLLGDDMGLGKTVQAIAACHALFGLGRVKRGLLIVPASLKGQWRREWIAFSDVPVEIVDGPAGERAAIYRRTREGFLIANYEQALRDLPLMQGWAPGIVVLDEAQRIKNWATKTAGQVKQLQPGYRLILTGTPMENRLDELASLMDWIDDQALEPKWRLVPWHTVTADGRHEVVGARNLESLRRRLSGRLLRRLRSEVLGQLPPRTDVRVPVELEPAQREEHAALDLPIARLVAIAKRRPLSQAEFLRLMTLLAMQRMICNGLALARFEEVWPELAEVRRPGDELLARLASPKLLELRALIRSVVVEQGRKVVVFSQWRRMLELAGWAIGETLERHGLRALFFSGGESQRRRTQNLVDFHDDPAAKVLLATDAGGVGLNLQGAASACINLELPWNPAVLEQRIGRIHRLGQRHPIDVYLLISEEGIESRIVELVASKRALFNGLFDGQSDEVRFESGGSFVARLERLLEEPEPATEAARLDDPSVSEEAADESEAVFAGEPSHAGPEPEAAHPPAGEASAPAATVVVPVRSISEVELARVLAQIAIRTTPGGGVTIEAPPAAATALAGVLRDLAQRLTTPLA